MAVKSTGMKVSSSQESTATDRDVAIAVMGPTGSGKTSFINLVSGSGLQVGGGLQSCTSAVQMAAPFELDGRRVTLIDAPGFDDTTRSDTAVLKMIAKFLATAYQDGRKLAGVIYFHRISDFRMGGISKRNFEMFKRFCGDSTLKNVIIVTNMWGEVSREIGEAREAELASEDIFFKPALDNGAHLLRHENTITSGHMILRNIIRNYPLALRIQREIVDEGKDISQTAAGETLIQDLREQVERYRAEIHTLREEMKAAIVEKDEEMKKVLEEEMRKLQAQMTRVQTDSEELASNHNDEKIRLEQLVENVADKARKEAAAAAAKHQEEIRLLRNQLKPEPKRGFTLECCIQ